MNWSVQLLMDCPAEDIKRRVRAIAGLSGVHAGTLMYEPRRRVIKVDATVEAGTARRAGEMLAQEVRRVLDLPEVGIFDMQTRRLGVSVSSRP